MAKNARQQFIGHRTGQPTRAQTGGGTHKDKRTKRENRKSWRREWGL